MVKLGNELRGKVLVMGIGNLLKGDDGVGPHFIQKIKDQRSKLKTKVELLDAGTAPENFTGKIKQFKPDTLLIVDAVDFGGQPGEVKIFGMKDFGAQSFSTHNISLSTFVKYLKENLPKLKVLVMGIQPKQVGYGEGLSEEVERKVEELCTSFI